MKSLRPLNSLAAVAIATLAGCGDLASLTASLGGSEAGDRGTIRVIFINNTTEQAVFSVATYDHTDQDSRPDIEQFGLGASDRPLNGGESSAPIPIDCGRTLAIGSPRLIELANENLTDVTLDPVSLIEGVDFYATVDGDPVDDAVDEPAIVGSAPPFEARLGVDFPCNGLVIIRFEVGDAGDQPYRVDFEVVPSETTR